MATVNEILAVNGQGDEQEPWCAADDCDIIDIRGEDLVALAADGVVRWTNNRREWSEVEPSDLAKTLEDIYGSGRGGHIAEAKQVYDAMCEHWQTIAPLSEYLPDAALVCGVQVKQDASGQGHCWRNTVAALDIPANIREEIEGEILDGDRSECADFVASNGLHYRW